MARKFFRKYLPHPSRVKEHRVLAMFGTMLHAPNLWHLNRDSVSRAFGIGLFWALIPMPFQMIPAAACAILLRANVALSVALVWVTNPLTMGPIYYAAYRFGRLVLGMGPSELKFKLTYRSMAENIAEIWQPLFAGSIVGGLIIGGASYVLIQTLWRWNLRRRWRIRLHRLAHLRHHHHRRHSAAKTH